VLATRWGLPRSQFASPVPYPTSCSPQAWASAAPLLLLRSFLGLDPHVPHKKVTVCPQLPTAWGRVTLTDLWLGAITLHFEAEGETVKTLGVPDDWQLLTPAF
jgi:glycogen debranching enzyme